MQAKAKRMNVRWVALALAVAAGVLTNTSTTRADLAEAWGYNHYGQLGDGPKTYSLVPVIVTDLSSGVTAIAAGDYHSLAVQNGGIYVWGANGYGQLGDGTTISRSTPVAIAGLSSGVTAIAGSSSYSLAVQNGGVYAWGSNLAGQLGDGTTHDSLLPERIDPTDLTDIVAVAACYDSSYALSADGSLWVWGDSGEGALGLGLGTRTSDYRIPHHLLPPTGYAFTSIDADGNGLHVVATLASVPEPASLSLLTFAGLGLLGRRRRYQAGITKN